MHKEQDVVSKYETAKEIMKCYCFIIMEFIVIHVEVP